MTFSIIRGKYVICKVESRASVQIVEDGGVLQRDGRILEVGPHADIAHRHPDAEVLGSADDVVLPGFVNAHHHLGLTPFQLGSPDMPLELWFATRLACRDVDPYLDTLHSAFEMIESGITTVQHIHGRIGPPLERIAGAADAVIRAYRDIGMRVSYSFSLRDQNRLVYEADEDFARRLPPPLDAELADLLRRQAVPLADNFALFDDLCSRYHGMERVQIQFAPANLHWCSDRALTMLKEHAERHQALMHIHLVETREQKEYARRRSGTTALRHLEALGLLGPRLTLGHGVWLTEDDVERIAASGTCICHNASSNLRVRAGIAPLNEFARRGIRTAIGLDEAGLNDDRDMLLEMRLVLRLHRTPGMDDGIPTAPQVFKMATEDGAHTTPFGADIGIIEPGRAADLVILRWADVAFPYLDDEIPVVDAILQRARSSAVKTVLVAGEPIYRDGRFTRLDKEAVRRELARSLAAPPSAEERCKRDLSRKLLPHVRDFYSGYVDERPARPFYSSNSAR